MTSRDAILNAVAAAQPDALPLPQIAFGSEWKDVVQQFSTVLTSIGGAAIEVENKEAALAILKEQFAGAQRVVHTGEQKEALTDPGFDPHSLADVDLAIIESHLGVAENGAIWVTDADIVQRALPFITQNLAVLLPKAALVPTMHDAYLLIGERDYGFGVFIAGPSKTADIEQSLVLGAHGSKSMTVFLIKA